nr:aminotransferase class I/II-fold pyridoxal phosphate-dependent enzyme [Pseudomonas sp.]
GGEPGTARRHVLQQRIKQFRDGVSAMLGQDAGAHLLDSSTPIQPLVLGSNARTMALAERLGNQGILVGAIRPPTVPLDTARLRITLSAAHSSDDVDTLISALRCALTETSEQPA